MAVTHARQDTGPTRTGAGPSMLRPALRRRQLGAAVLAASAVALAFGTPASGASLPAAPVRTLLTVVSSTMSAYDAAAAVTARGGAVVAVYPVAEALLVELPAGASTPAGTTAVADVALHVASTTLTTSRTPTATMDVRGATYRASIGASDSARGAGVTVAVIDTGVADVPDLAGRVTHINVSGGAAGDGLGHGTFMAGLVAGDGSSSAGAYTGVAPSARILDVQVATADGTTSLSRVLAGIQAVSDAAAIDPSVRVVSLALSTGSPLPPSADPLARGLDRLWARGITVVVAAGNDGPDARTVSSPGADPVLITVGALDEHATSARTDDTVSEFSSRATSFGVVKPDLVAPGMSLVSTRAPGSTADIENPSSRVADSYFTGSGTSMSEAVAAGAVAALLGSRPALTPDTVKKLLTRNAYGSATLRRTTGAGAGGLDLGAALAEAPSAALLRPSKHVVVLADQSFGPDPADADAWTQFSSAWVAGDFATVTAIWGTLSEQTRRWAATAFALTLVSENSGGDPEEFSALQLMARHWATQGWSARSWATDAFVARSWAARSWAARSWAARSWAIDDWAARSWADSSWSARSWAGDGWSARSWAQVDWLAFAWTARSWASDTWAASGWDSQAWSARSWSARSWTDFSWSARSWAVGRWDARSWSAYSWAGEASDVQAH